MKQTPAMLKQLIYDLKYVRDRAVSQAFINRTLNHAITSVAEYRQWLIKEQEANKQH